MEEIWKDIKGYEGLYQVSNLGRVKSLDKIMLCKDGKIHHWKEKLLKQQVSHKGYFTVKLQNNKIKHMCQVHRLVAEAFLHNTNNLPQVDHINGDKQCNVVTNLRFADNKTNANNPNTKWKLSHQHTEEWKNRMSVLKQGKAPTRKCLEKARKLHEKKIQSYNKEGHPIKTYNSLTEASSDIGKTISAISNSIKRNQYCCGMKWVFVD